MNLDLGWRDFGEFVAIVSAVAFLLWLWLRMKIQSEFATHDDLQSTREAIDDQFEAVEERLSKQAAAIREMAAAVAQMPTQLDIRDLSERVAGVERSVAVVGETAKGIKESIGKVDNTLTLFIESKIRESRNGAT